MHYEENHSIDDEMWLGVNFASFLCGGSFARVYFCIGSTTQQLTGIDLPLCKSNEWSDDKCSWTRKRRTLNTIIIHSLFSNLARCDSINSLYLLGLHKSYESKMVYHALYWRAERGNLCEVSFGRNTEWGSTLMRNILLVDLRFAPSVCVLPAHTHNES